MATKDVQLELIDDNPYNPRTHYPRNKVDSMAHSLKEMGQLEIPKAREVDGRVQLSQGHLRKRAFLKLQKQDPKKWTTMRLDVEDISDQDMFYFALEENLQRSDVMPLEIARSIDSFITLFPNESEEKVAKKFKMTQPNVSNMRRVLRLPEEILQRVDDGRINFTQGRELLVLEKLPKPVEMMKDAISQIKTEKMNYGKPNTVEGMQQAVHYTVENHTRPLDKEWQGYRRELLFDTRAAGCLKCDRIVITRPTKSQNAHYCLDEKCWEEHQEEHREVAAAAAKAQMEADILQRTAQEIEPTISQEIKEPDTEKAQKLVAVDETGGVIPSPCDSCAKADTCDRTYFHVAADGSGQLVCEDKVKQAPEEVKLPPPEVPEDILALAREKAGTRAVVLDLQQIYTGDQWNRRPKAGYAILKGGSNNELQHMHNPDECTERCTKGFHFAFDSKYDPGKTFFVCDDVKCMALKKAAFTRMKNATGQALKRAETKAVKEAIAQTTTIDRARSKLILLAQLDGQHCSRYSYGSEKTPETWLWEKLSAGTPGIERKRADLLKRIDKLSDEDLAKLVVEFMLYFLMDHGDIGTYKSKAAEPLKWMGVTIEQGASDEKKPAESTSRHTRATAETKEAS